MSRHVHALTRWRIRRLFAEGLAPQRYRALLEDLHGCSACAALFARQSELESAICGEPSPFALERVEAAVLDRLSNDPADAQSKRWRGALVAACAVALVMALGRVTPERQHLGRETSLTSVTARGELPPRSANVGIRLLRATPEKISESSKLSIGDVVTFTWTDVDPAARYLAILGVQQDGRVRWYYPGDEGAMSIRLERAQIDEPLGDGIRLSVRHAPGWLRVTALFSPRPIAKAEIEDAVRALGERKGALEGLAPLPMAEGVLEHSIRVDIAAGP